jgi:hypothetical protein
VNIIEAVQALVDKGGKIRRATWLNGEWVTANGDYYFTFWTPGPDGRAQIRGRGTPTPEQMLASDWEWTEGKP